MGCTCLATKNDKAYQNANKNNINKRPLHNQQFWQPGNYKTIAKKYIINPEVLGHGNFGKVFLGTSH